MPEADTPADLQADLDLVREAAAEAGRIALGYFRNDPEVWLKAGQSPVSAADLAADRYLRETLLSARPGYGWLSEESPADPARGGARTFVVDPVDGTRGFIEGLNLWCVSVAVVEAGRPLVGVLDCPARGEVFAASLGGGAFKDGVRLLVRSPGERLALGGPKPLVDALPASLLERAQRLPHVPSLAYRIAMIADGRLDASFVKPNAHDWDLAAAELILAEAGGRLVDASGEAPGYGRPGSSHGVLAAGSGRLLDDLHRVIAR